MGSKGRNVYEKLREAGKLKDFLVFLIFLCIAAFFWFLTTIDAGSRSDFKDTVRNLFGTETQVDGENDTIQTPVR